MTSHNILICVVSVLALTACGQNSAPAGDAVPADAVPNDEVAQPNAAATTSLWNSGQAKPLDIQVAHPNGVVLQVNSIQSRETSTAIGVRVINGRKDDAELNRYINNREGYLLLDSGERLYISPPASNAKLSVPAGQTFEGELVFVGRLPQANAGILVLNEDASVDNENTSSPGFRVDIPLAASATGSSQ